MKDLTVCLMNDSFPPIIDGVANVVENYASIIEKKYGHSLVVTPAYPEADDSVFSFPVVRYPSIDTRKKSHGYMAGIPFSSELSAQLKQQRMDIVHAHCPMMSALLARSLRNYIDAPMIMTYHTKYDIDIANVIRNKTMQLAGIKAVVSNVNVFDEVWVVSDGAGQNLKSLGYQGDYIVMPNGVDIDRRRADAQAVQRDTGSYDLPEGVPVFLFVGRLMWYKGIQIILDALRKLQEKKQDFRMVMIGDGGDGEDIRMYTKSLGLQKKVIFTGAISDREVMRSWYTRADLFLFPSTFDSNGLVVREAAACDLASVLIQGSCAAEGVTDGENAFFIQENAESLYWTLAELVRNPESLRRVGKCAGDSLFLSWEDAVSSAVERYQVVLDQYRSGAYQDKDTSGNSFWETNGDLMFTVARLAKASALRKSNSQSYRRNLQNSRKITGKKKGGRKYKVKRHS